MIRAVGVGAGGHAKVILEALETAGGVEVVGLLDARPDLVGSLVCGVAVLGGDEFLQRLRATVTHAFVGLGSLGEAGPRRRLFALLLHHGFEPLRVVHRSAVVSRSAELGRGPIVLANAVVNADAHMGDNVIVNTGAIVEHDCVLADHVHVATGARLAGGVRVGDGAHIGVGASVREGVSVGKSSIIGAGAVVVKDVPDGVVVVGVPARVLRSVSKQ